MTVSQRVAQFIEGEGHRVELSCVEGEQELCELVFRTRGQMFSVAVSELEADRFSISTAYEIPDFVREPAHTLDVLGDIEADYPETRFMLAHDDTIFIATVEYQATDPEVFLEHFWSVVGRLRDAGTAALERMVDRSESKAAADKFIRQFMKGDR
ncbi:MAG TPA: hypothetical protein VNG31_03020 [Candidatus Baltobacteraceae bacterium]|nr:hypothetical protein [Candidatus Baltobacteraceae bacterium]